VNIEYKKLDSFSVIGFEGTTDDGAGFMQKLWGNANARFNEIAPVVARGDDGAPLGFWGLMSDMDMTFAPWENFSRGRYLAGAQVNADAAAPEGWTKWTVPASEYAVVDMEGVNFMDVINALNTNGTPIVGAVYDFNSPANGRYYNYFPIKRL